MGATQFGCVTFTLFPVQITSLYLQPHIAVNVGLFLDGQNGQPLTIGVVRTFLQYCQGYHLLPEFHCTEMLCILLTIPAFVP